MMSRPIRLAALATLLLGIGFPGIDPPNSLAQSTPSVQSSSAGTALVAVMPQSAHTGLRILPADPSWFAKGFSGNLLIVEQQWSIARGTSIDAECSVAAPPGEIAELMPLEQFAGARAPRGFLDGAGVRTVSLGAILYSGIKPQGNLR